MDEKDLVKRARAGDKTAFSQLYINRRDSLYRYAYFRLQNEHDAQDAVAACVASAFASIATLKNEKAFSAWIFRILYRECCAVLRRRIQRRDERNLDDFQNLPVYDSNLAPELSEALNTLSEQEREIVLLSAVAEYKSPEIAAMLGLKPATVRTKLSRALAKMRSFLE